LNGFSSTKPYDKEAAELLEAIPGGDNDLVMRGGSAIIAPNTNYVNGPFYEKATILYGELLLDEIIEGHMALDTSGHYSRPDIFHLEVDDKPQSTAEFKSSMKAHVTG